MPNNYRKSSIHRSWKNRQAAELFRSGISLHSHTLHSRENMAFLPRHAYGIPIVSGIIRKQGQKLIEINCMPDHAHLLIGLKPSIALSDLIRDVKSDSSEFINRKRWIRGKFNWQEGFGSDRLRPC